MSLQDHLDLETLMKSQRVLTLKTILHQQTVHLLKGIFLLALDHSSYYNGLIGLKKSSDAYFLGSHTAWMKTGALEVVTRKARTADCMHRIVHQQEPLHRSLFGLALLGKRPTSHSKAVRALTMRRDRKMNIVKAWNNCSVRSD
jgi:hypothetical protein